MTSKRSKKIKTKNQALDFLDQLILKLNEEMFFLSQSEIDFFVLAKKKIKMMKNSINHSDHFFDEYFLNKKESEIIRWVEKEAQKW